MEGNQACLQCHQKFRDTVSQHTHHAATSSGSLCYNCHMPHTTYGLLKAIRSHRIDSPTVRATLQTGRPNACNLCHLDQTLVWTAQHLTDWYGQPSERLSDEQRAVSAALLWLIKGDAGQRALIAWSMGWEPAQAASRKEWMAPYLAQLLNDPYSAVRYIAFRSLKSLRSDYKALSYDFVGPEAQRTASRVSVIDIWKKTEARSAPSDRAELLITGPGELNGQTVAHLLRERDNLSMDLQE